MSLSSWYRSAHQDNTNYPRYLSIVTTGRREIVSDYLLWYENTHAKILGMITQTLLNHVVTVQSARGPIRRTVVAELGDVLILADLESADEAKMAGITPFSIGFPRNDVLIDEGLDSQVLLKHNVQYEPAEHGGESSDHVDVGGRQQPSKHQQNG
jgi:hypothetical protein